MFDKLHIRIPVLRQYVAVSKLADKHGNEMGAVIKPENLGVPLSATMLINKDNNNQSQIKISPQQWDTIESSISGVAFGFMHRGFGLAGWPHVILKASPAKVIQGHNVFGSEDFRPGFYQMLTLLNQAYPKLYEILDIPATEIRGLDCTYSARVESTYWQEKIFNLLPEVMPNKESTSKYTGYLQCNNKSRFKKQKVYHKEQEVLAELEKARKARRHDRVSILGDPRLLEWVRGLIRLEACLSAQALDYHGIPTRMNKFIQYSKDFEAENGQTLCSHLHQITFKKMFKALEGTNMSNVDDYKIKTMIDSKYLVYKDSGKVCRRRSLALMRFYRSVKTESWEVIKETSGPTYYRNCKLLNDAGIPMSLIKTCHLKDAGIGSTNIGELLKIDYDNQRPEWYKEPVAKVTSKNSYMDGANDDFKGDVVMIRPNN